MSELFIDGLNMFEHIIPTIDSKRYLVGFVCLSVYPMEEPQEYVWPWGSTDGPWLGRSPQRCPRPVFWGHSMALSFWETCSRTYFGSGCWFDTQAARSTASWALVIVLLVDQHGIGMRGTGGDLQLGTRRHRAGIQLGLPKTGVFSYLAMATLMGNMMISND